jgi:hypothetical protein
MFSLTRRCSRKGGGRRSRGSSCWRCSCSSRCGSCGSCFTGSSARHAQSACSSGAAVTPDLCSCLIACRPEVASRLVAASIVIVAWIVDHSVETSPTRAQFDRGPNRCMHRWLPLFSPRKLESVSLATFNDWGVAGKWRRRSRSSRGSSSRRDRAVVAGPSIITVAHASICTIFVQSGMPIAMVLGAATWWNGTIAPTEIIGASAFTAVRCIQITCCSMSGASCILTGHRWRWLSSRTWSSSWRWDRAVVARPSTTTVTVASI